MKKLMILTLLTVAIAGVAVQKASAGVVVRAAIGLPGIYAPAPAYYAAPAPAYTYVPNYTYAPPATVVYAPPAVVYAPPPVVFRAPVFLPPVIGLSFGTGFHHHSHHGRW